MLFELESVNNSDELQWIWMRFGGVHGECVVMLLCKNELNRRGLRFGGNSKVYKVLFELESFNNSDELQWIWMRFYGVHGEYVLA